MQLLQSENFALRMRAAVTLAWNSLSQKIASGAIVVYKEASLQLQYAVLLQQLLPLIQFHPEEKYRVELECSVTVGGVQREIDVLFVGEVNSSVHKIAIEMKCYRTIAASGGKRGATDIFMKDVYFDLHLLESYIAECGINQGVALVMNDLKRLVQPAQKSAKCWDYDVSNGIVFGPSKFDTPIGGKPVNFALDKFYRFDWQPRGLFWFLEVEGRNGDKNEF
jgi:hypothetical protein